MSLPERSVFRHPQRPARWHALALALVLLVLGACAYEPLYGSRSGDSARVAAAIEIAPVKERVGHIVRNHLIDSLTPDGQPTHPDYRLTLSVEQSMTPLLIQRDDHATRYNLTLRVAFALADRSGEIVYRDTARATSSFNVSESGFANVMAQRDAADEAARLLSTEIRTLLLLNLPR